jgi:hypothetical protein
MAQLLKRLQNKGPTGSRGMGFSDPEIQKKVFGPRWQPERWRVTRSAKLGITSVALLLIALGPPFRNWRYRITSFLLDCRSCSGWLLLSKETGGG